MHRNIVGVPAYFRPELLYLCLEHLYESDRDNNHDVWVCQDRKFGDNEKFVNEWKETENVLEYWQRAYGARMKAILRPENGWYGNSCNILSFYARAYKTDARYVYLVEDDVFVTPDFFKWHEAVQESGDYFCTIAGQSDRNPNMAPSPGGFFESSEYASLGVGWKRENLGQIVEHANTSYYHNLSPYILDKFPNSHLGLKMMEQDGLVQRVMEASHAKAAWACLPRAYHVGLFGYHRGIGKDMVEGFLPDRIDKYRAALSDKDWLDRVADFQTDIQPFPTKRLPEFNFVSACRPHSNTI